MSDEEHLERLQQAVLKWHQWQAANRPPLADLRHNERGFPTWGSVRGAKLGVIRRKRSGG
jgi:hypothetical protein